jgi:hypothetical protein
MSELVDRLFAIHDALADAGLAHAFGGAIALAYCVEEPRGTRDLDVNIFKAFFDRTKDWADIEAISIATPEDIEGAAATIAETVGENDPAVAKLRALAP